MKLNVVNELTVGLAFVCTLAAVVVISIVGGTDSLAATHLPDLTILLGGGLLGLKAPRP